MPWLMVSRFETISGPSRSSPVPYTTLFRSLQRCLGRAAELEHQGRARARIRVLGEGEVIHAVRLATRGRPRDRKSTRLNSSHRCISYAVFCLKKKKKTTMVTAA